MLHSEVFLFAGIAGSAMLFWVAKDFILSKSTKKTSKKQKQTIVLDTIAVIWSKRKEAILNIEELSLLWRSLKSEADRDKEEIKFYNETLNKFFKEHIEGKLFFTGNTKKVILNLLTLLDTEGNVSSVVSGQQDTEGKIGQDIYKKLSSISLLEHTIHVAEEVIQIIPYGPMVPKGIIAALGHDIGKIPKYRQQYYAFGDHPFISVSVLEQLPDFKNLVYADDVLKAVRDHHLKPKDKLTEYLKEADQRARRRELSQTSNVILTEEVLGQTGDPHVDNISTVVVSNADTTTVDNKQYQTETYQTHQTQYQTITKPDINQTTNQTTNQIYQTVSNEGISKQFQAGAFGLNQYISAEEESESTFDGIPEIFGLEEEKQGNYKYEKMKSSEDSSYSNIFISPSSDVVENQRSDNRPKQVSLEWLSLKEFLNRIRKHINILDDKKTWKAFSMNNGVVYVLPDLIFTELKAMAEEQGILDLDLASSDKSIKRDYIYSVLCRVRDELDGIETSLIKDGYFSAPFILEDKDGKRISRALYIPFKAREAFGVDVGTLEVIKKGRLLDIKRVYPPQND